MTHFAQVPSTSVVPERALASGADARLGDEQQQLLRGRMRDAYGAMPILRPGPAAYLLVAECLDWVEQ
jgi:hypothetical protein